MNWPMVVGVVIGVWGGAYARGFLEVAWPAWRERRRNRR